MNRLGSVLSAMLVGACGCATVGPPAAPDDVNAALYGETVTIRTADGGQYDGARAVVLTADSVRFVAAGATPTEITALALPDVVEVSQPGRSSRGIGILPGLAAGVGLAVLFQQIAPDASLSRPAGSLVLVGLGGALGWWVGDREVPDGARRILYSNPPAP